MGFERWHSQQIRWLKFTKPSALYQWAKPVQVAGPRELRKVCAVLCGCVVCGSCATAVREHPSWGPTVLLAKTCL